MSDPGTRPIRELHYLNHAFGWRSWLLSTDHKRIGLLYLVAITAFFAIGGLLAGLMRLELLTPAGDLVEPDQYNRLFTSHGIVMVWFFLIPSIPAVLGNFLLPMMIGARDMAFPRLNLASWYLFVAGGVLTMVAVLAGGVDTGWTFYTPLSTTYTDTNVNLAAFGILVSGFSSVLTAVNFMTSIHTLRAPGLTWFRLPLFAWSMYATSIIMLLATPVLAVLLLLIGVERILDLGVFDPSRGGDPLLFQHLFWFYSHPAVYIMVLPAMGVTSEIVATFARRRVYGYRFVVYATLAIAVFGFLVWGHHMFTSGQSLYASTVFSALSMLVAVPSAVKVFNWTATLYKGAVVLATPMLYALGFIGLFTIGGLTGVMLASLGIDIHVHDTYFVVAHFHYIMVGGALMGYLGGLHYWWPKISGRMYSTFLSKLAALLVFVGFNLTFFPQFILGYLGMPRRYHAYPDDWQVLNVLSTAGASILGVGYLLPILYLVWSMRYGDEAPENPWEAAGLEWKTSSPPVVHNFETTPTVTGMPYHEPDDGELRAPVPEASHG